MRRRLPATLLTTTVLWATAVSAERYTLDELVTATLAHNPAVQISQEKLHQQQLTRDQVILSRHPASLTWSGDADWSAPNLLQGVTAGGTPTGTSSTAMVLSKTLYRYQGGALDATERKASLQLEKSLLSLRRQRQRLRQQVLHAGYDLLVAIAHQQEDQQALERLREHGRISEIFYQQGRVWKNDLLQSAVKIAQGEKRLIASRNRILRAKATINQLLDRNIDDSLELSGELAIPDELPQEWSPLDHQLQQQQHPELLSARLDQALAAADVEVQQAADSPELTLSGSYRQGYDLAAGESEQEDLVLGLTLNWEIWDSGGRDKALASSRSAHLQSGIRLHEMEQTIRVAARNSWYSLQEARDHVTVLQQALESARENYRVNQIRYQEKMGSASDLLEAEDMLSSTRKDWLTALADLNKAYYSLQYALGVERLPLE